MTRITCPCLIVLLHLGAAADTRSDIFQWEYINPGDPGLGKQQSTTLTPDGAGVNAGPGAELYNRNLTMAYLIGKDLTGANGYAVNLTDADLSQANLTNANLYTANLT
ncbi:MAG TPA: pentapeptide repeat-containing protein, partial [Lacipirellulaceae bacterium]|nr:pentapeptide repeat-containing protein [Lacipirellulaceae bacterium]